MSNVSRAQDPEIAAALTALPDKLAIGLRDVIRGLEAEAGTARALVRRSEDRRRRDTEHAAHQAWVFKDQRDAARSERDAARHRVEELESRLTELEARETLRLSSTRGLKRLHP